MPLNTGLTAFAFNSIHQKDTRLYAVQLLVKVPITEQMQHYFQKLEYSKKNSPWKVFFFFFLSTQQQVCLAAYNNF